MRHLYAERLSVAHLFAFMYSVVPQRFWLLHSRLEWDFEATVLKL